MAPRCASCSRAICCGARCCCGSRSSLVLLVVYLLSSWLPTLINSSGVTLKTASLITAMFQVGGTIGAVAIGRMMDKLNPHYVLGIAYASAGIFVFLIGHASTMPWLMVLAVFGAGFCVSGGQVGANALSAAYYPTASRATGVSGPTASVASAQCWLDARRVHAVARLGLTHRVRNRGDSGFYRRPIHLRHGPDPRASARDRRRRFAVKLSPARLLSRGALPATRGRRSSYCW